MVWLRFTAVPLKAWSERCFVELGGLIGEVNLVDEDTRSKSFLCEGRVLIVHEDKSKLHSIITLMVNGKGFPIMVTKHEWRMDSNWWLASERWSSMFSKSGSEYSDDSYGEADLNANGCLGDEGVKDAEDCTVMDEDSNWVLRRNANFEEGDSVDVFESSGLRKHGLVEEELVGPNGVGLEAQRVGRGYRNGLVKDWASVGQQKQLSPKGKKCRSFEEYMQG
ncbi:hypothetical protein SLE2022_292210 [Rubroshorea leprosula]